MNHFDTWRIDICNVLLYHIDIIMTDCYTANQKQRMNCLWKKKKKKERAIAATTKCANVDHSFTETRPMLDSY